jgi:protein-S-isoprenylcysteine O-methyltransferase Ste14
MTRLAIRTILGFVTLLVLLGAGAFIPARTFNYWQAWLCIAGYLLCSVWITLYLWKNDRSLLERRLRAGPTAETRKAQQVIMVLANLGFMALFVVSALDHRLGWTRVPVAVVILGNILILFGFWVEFLVFRVNSFTSATVEIARDQRVISTGPYSVVRHPMYAGGLLLLFGTPLALASYWGLAVLAAMMPVLLWRLFDEEKFLASNLAGYEEYRAQVRSRLIPGLF